MVTEKLPGTPQGTARAGAILRAGGVAAIPTETVYGLAANALDPEAVRKIFAAKGRPADNPLIVHIASLDQWPPLVREIPEAARKLAEAFWPGPLTIILEKSDRIPMETSGGLDTVGVRCPAHPLARAVIQAAGVPLAAPSANLSGRPSPTTFAHAWEDLEGRVDAVLDGGDCGVGVESTVVSLTGERARVLRPGGVTVDSIRGVLGPVELDPAVTAMLAPGQKAASPGMKYKHYAPKAELAVLDGSPEAFARFVNAQEQGTAALCFSETEPLLARPALCLGSRYDGAEQARRLFEALHRLDLLGVKRAYAQMPNRRGVGLAVYNRLLRAAAFRVEPLPGPRVVGLVGPSGAGKSTVAQGLAPMGFSLVDCDRLTRSPQVYNPDCLRALGRAFGEDLVSGGVLDRRGLAERAFRDQASRKLLGEITFPHIERAVRREIAGCRGTVLLDAPTLFESGLDSLCGRILTVTAPEKVRLERVMARDGLTKAQALERFQAQYPAEFYEARGDFVLENTGDISRLLEEAARELKGG